MTTQTESKFVLSISMNVLEHLGINLYSNVPSVLSEIVANAWDADATTVTVDWDRGKDIIVIQDNGIGMTAQQANGRFLTVGYRRRDNQPGLTPLGRKPMGRKGIGKLSLFSIADNIKVETVSEGERSAFLLDLNEIRSLIQDGTESVRYEPEALSAEAIDFPHGTRLTLTELRKKQTASTPRALRKRVARRFSMIGTQQDFQVVIDGTPVTPADRGYYDKLEFI